MNEKETGELTMEKIRAELEIDGEAEVKKITTFVKKSVKALKKEGALIGLSGGVDSSVCAYLLVKALGKKKVLGVFLPERDSAPVHREHAHLVAKNLGIETVEADISGALEAVGVYAIGPEELKDEKQLKNYDARFKKVQKIIGPYMLADRLAEVWGGEISSRWKFAEIFASKELHRGNAFSYTKVRMRMVHLSFYALQNNYANVGTTDKTEYTIGLYDKYGDGANDITILRHLYKTQIRKLGAWLEVPREIVDKPHSGDLYGNRPHTDLLGMSYEDLDMLLVALKHGAPEALLKKIVPAKGVESIRRAMEIAAMIGRLPLALDEERELEKKKSALEAA